jgi:hypothetical protein
MKEKNYNQLECETWKLENCNSHNDSRTHSTLKAFLRSIADVKGKKIFSPFFSFGIELNYHKSGRLV